MANNKNKKQTKKKYTKTVTTNKKNSAVKKTTTKKKTANTQSIKKATAKSTTQQKKKNTKVSTNKPQVTTKQPVKKQTTVKNKIVVPKKVVEKEEIKPIIEKQEIIKQEIPSIEQKEIKETKIDIEVKETTPKVVIEKEQVETTKTKINKYQKMYQNNKKNAKKNTNNKKRKVVDNKEVIYNVALNKEQENKKDTQKKIKYVSLKEFLKLKLKRKHKKVIDPKVAKQLEKLQKTQAYKISLLQNQEEKETNKKPLKDYSKSNIFVRTCVTIYRNLHIIFNSIIIITFIILLLGLILPKVYSTKTILFCSSLLLFLIIVAITQNKYLSGKIFTTILTAGMIFAIHNLQYTYDFISIMNKNKYSYKTYYVVAFDNNINRSINSINNKKVGLIDEYETKVSRVLNTKISNVTYLTYEDEDTLFNDFYKQTFRAVIVNDNQLKYLENNPQNNKKIKVLHKFKAVTKK